MIDRIKDCRCDACVAFDAMPGFELGRLQHDGAQDERRASARAEFSAAHVALSREVRR